MAYKNGLSAGKMAARIYNREDNIYKQSMNKEILDMYAKEIYKAMMDGERVQISKVGTIFPELYTEAGISWYHKSIESTYAKSKRLRETIRK